MQIAPQRASSTTHQLIAESAPLTDVVHKHREDWIDALLCASTAASYSPVQVLGPPRRLRDIPAATIIAPASRSNDAERTSSILDRFAPRLGVPSRPDPLAAD
jgi:hypothetical protein